MEALQRGVPGDILSGKQRWEDSGLTYTDVFIEREQRWFEDKYADGTIIFPPQPSLLLHIGVEDGVDALARVLANLGHYPDNLMYENSTDAICDFQAAVNDATGNKYATWMVQDWGLPGNCDYDMGQQASTAAFADDLRFESSGLCVDPRFMPNAARPGHFPCNGAAEQKVSFEPVAEDRFLIKFTSTGQCFEGLSVWTCHGDPHQVWEWRGAQLYNVGVDKCLTARQNNRWGGGLLTMETCADTPAQRINSG
ncbi:MAG: RICIN domain-containing protein [Actinomycetota bacterium]